MRLGYLLHAIRKGQKAGQMDSSFIPEFVLTKFTEAYSKLTGNAISLPSHTAYAVAAAVLELLHYCHHHQFRNTSKPFHTYREICRQRNVSYSTIIQSSIRVKLLAYEGLGAWRAYRGDLLVEAIFDVGAGLTDDEYGQLVQ